MDAKTTPRVCLKSLYLQGYKSFAGRHEFVFEEGMTAIIGPNGSGKSNISDAIRWVLGEQSYVTLRGKKTEDMIFSGSEVRPRQGMTQVTLTLDNTDGWLPLDYSEVTISRRAYRSGENEYLLNGARVRLRDINELLAKGGLSHRTYMVIGQGTVDRALSLRPEERRELFEEAAGIILHQQQRREALEKLEATKANLVRLHDIISEITPRLTRLEQQAARASEHNTLLEKLEQSLRRWYEHRWHLAQQALREATGRVEACRSKADVVQAEVNEFDRRAVELKGRLSELRHASEELSAQRADLTSQRDQIERLQAVNAERSRLMEEQREDLLAELSDLNRRLENETARMSVTEAETERLADELERARQALRQLQEQVDEHEQFRQQKLSEEARLRSELHKLEAAIAECRARRSDALERRSSLTSQLEERRQGFADLLAQLTQADQLIEAGQNVLDELSGGERSAAQQINEAKEQLRQAVIQARVAENRHAESLAKLRRVQDRFELLEKMHADLEGYAQGVREVFQASRRSGASPIGGVIGTVSQLIQVSPELELAIETALGPHLQDIITENWQTAEAAIAHLRSTRRGRATFLPLDTVRVPSRLNGIPPLEGILGVASELVHHKEVHSRAIEMLLNRTLVVKDLKTARQTFSTLKGGFRIVTLSGELLQSNGVLSGGGTSKKAQASFLARERELRDLRGEVTRLQRDQQGGASRLAQAEQRRTELEQQIERLSTIRQDIQAKHEEHRLRLLELERRRERARSAAEWQREHTTALGAEVKQLTATATEQEERLESLQLVKEQLEHELDQVEARFGENPREDLLDQFHKAQTRLALLEGELHSRQGMLESYRQHSTDLQQQIAAKQERIARLSQEQEALATEAETSRKRLRELQVQLAECSRKLEPQQQEKLRLEAKLQELEQLNSQQKNEFSRLEAEYSRLELERARCEDTLQNLARHIEDDLGMVQLGRAEKDSLLPQPALPLLPSDPETVETVNPGLEEEIQQLKQQLKRIGAVNPEAPKEYAELKERHDFLAAQTADLEKAAGDLQRVVEEIDQYIQREFDTTFARVADYFKDYFIQLFGGGEAKLILTDAENTSERGVEVIARPPGKRFQNLAMLSGGERALAATALIFALLKASTTPFCILDEVDAMLDEANVERFREAVVELSQHSTQFILITHNRKTIEAANTIYGISMGPDSASTVISYKLDEQSAEQGGAHRAA